MHVESAASALICLELNDADRDNVRGKGIGFCCCAVEDTPCTNTSLTYLVTYLNIGKNNFFVASRPQ